MKLSALISFCISAPWTAENSRYNVNQNQNSNNPVDYQTSWPGHQYYPSPANWRVPFYTLMLDRFADGDPTNNAIFETAFEHDPLQVNFHHGGDLKGLIGKLDYLEALGIKGLYIAGTPFLNQPWDYHQYNPIDLTLLDPHRGTLEDWRLLSTEAHQRGMVIMIDLTVETLGDLTYFQGYLNKSAPLDLNGYDMIYRSTKTYQDFQLTNEKTDNCVWPKFYDSISGLPVQVDVPKSCYNDDFAHYGDLEAFGNFKAWERQLTKFSGVQDRVLDWSPRVAEILVRLSCLAIEGLDIDAIRVDKTTQMTLEFATKVWSTGIRQCASQIGKNNFFIPGEITSNINLASMYMGKGRLSTLRPTSVAEATIGNLDRYSVRQEYGLDSEAFHYSLYRSFLAFVGLKGSILVEGDPGADLIEAWNLFLMAVDYRNPYTGELDPRDLFAINNQDTFRWLTLVQGTEKLQIGLFLVSIVLPNGPSLYWGDEQGLYLHDSRSENYIYGRQPMTTSQAWQLHGCFKGNASYQFTNIEFNQKSRTGCLDDSQSMDHFNPTSSEFLHVQHLYHLRQLYPILQDGFGLETLSKIPLGDEQFVWSVSRTFLSVQNQPDDIKVWFLFTNSNKPVTITNGCDPQNPIHSPYLPETVVSDIFEKDVNVQVNTFATGVSCLQSLTLGAFGYRAYVEQVELHPMPARLIDIEPNHDSRFNILEIPFLDITLTFSKAIDCTTIQPNVIISTSPPSTASWEGVGQCQATPTQTIWTGRIANIQEGILEIQLSKAILSADQLPILSGAKWFYRFGTPLNVLVFPKQNEFSQVLQKNQNGSYEILHQAKGADLLRYSVDHEQTWTAWIPYQDTSLVEDQQGADDIQVTVEYWNQILASGVHRTTASYSKTMNAAHSLDTLTRFPSLYVQGQFNLFGNDLGVESQMKQDSFGVWTFTLAGSFPMNITLDVFNDNTFMFGDVDFDNVLDRLPPAAQDNNVLIIPEPPQTYTSWILMVDDRKMTWTIYPTGSATYSMIYMILLGLLPILSALVSVFAFQKIFYPVYINKVGRPDKIIIPVRSEQKLPKVLIATLEYEIPEWKIKVRIGGLGVIASLMGSTLPNEVIWIVPKVGDVDYPVTKEYRSLTIVICNQLYQVGVSKLVSNNITYYLLESPLFSSQSQKAPYPARMDDIYSAIFYSAWNQCIASIMMYENPDLYHINDFHGSLAPLYMLNSRTIPVVLSLHNAEFQGLWPLRTVQERQLFSSIFDLSLDLIDQYICFGHTFNMLHAAASYISYHQEGIGAGGVSQRYGERCKHRYAILWGLVQMERLQNPNPQDHAFVLPPLLPDENEKQEAVQLTQEWAELDIDPNVTIIVFVGRFSHQKGIDLIADLAPKLLTEYPNVQLICVGPVIDLYAKLAVEKLQRTSRKYLGRLYVRPEFTIVPECVYKAADFVLLPSRDEPFGLVAVEFGKKGVLGIGSFVGGLGSMPGWYYPIESSENNHLLNQFWNAIQLALKSTTKERRAMIQKALEQSFPVEEWLENILQLYQKVTKYDIQKEEYSLQHQRFVSELDSQNEISIAVDQVKQSSDLLLELIEKLKIESGGDEFPMFTDDDNSCFLKYQQILDKEKDVSIQQFLCDSEKEFYDLIQRQQLEDDVVDKSSFIHRFSMRIVQARVFQWPFYAILLLLGQILASSSFQIALLAESMYTKPWQFFAIGAVFVFASLIWYWAYRTCQPRLILSIPFLFYGMSFFAAVVIGNTFISIIPLLFYTIGTAALPFFFALNFMQESGSKISSWVLRAMIGETCRQIWTLGLWYWYSVETTRSEGSVIPKSSLLISLVGLLSLMITCLGVVLYFGLPRCYSQLPTSVPRFWVNLFKRRLVLWYWFAEIIKTYFLSGVFGRNSIFLWIHPLDTKSTLYIALIFQVIGIIALYFLASKSNLHSWILPIFAVGLLSPKWSQSAFSTSMMGFYLPWSGSFGSYVGVSLYLWLGVMDMIQSAGLIIMLLQTLTRIHVVPVMMVAQVLGSVTQMIAKLTAPNRDGPSSVFPAIANDIGPLKNPWFWIGWMSQLLICVGFFFWFRKEQLSKP